jgi:hypothetical protein
LVGRLTTEAVEKRFVEKEKRRKEREEDNTGENKYSMRRTEIPELVWDENDENRNTQR